MRRYETIIIIDPDLSDEERDPIFVRFKELISQQGGFLVLVDEWGIKKLAYEIMKKVRGYYIRLDYCGTAPLINELERFCRIDDRILKYMTILLETDVDIGNIEKEIAESEMKQSVTDQNDESGFGIDDSHAIEPESVEDQKIQVEDNGGTS
jgi:small subunit ribosomal protein S6